MTYQRPALPDIITRMRDDMVSRMPNGEVLRRSNAEVYSRSLAGAVHGLYGYLDWIARQLIYDTADSDMLERWAGIWGLTRKVAGYASGPVTLTGLDGAIVPAGAFLTAYDGLQYQVFADATIVGGTAPATVYCETAGLIGNRPAGQTLNLQSAIAGVNTSAVAGALVGGAEIESDDSLRSRFLIRIKQPPMGGSKFDYVNWALAVAGVTRAWCYPTEGGAGTVTVRFMMDNTYANGIPLAGDVAAVAAYIDPLRPVTALVTVAAPVAVPLNFTIASLSPATAAVKAAVTENLTDLIRREAQPGGTLYLSHIREAISAALGEIDHSLTSPAANVVNTTGNITTMGTITWV